MAQDSGIPLPRLLILLAINFTLLLTVITITKASECRGALVRSTFYCADKSKSMETLSIAYVRLFIEKSSFLSE